MYKLKYYWCPCCHPNNSIDTLDIVFVAANPKCLTNGAVHNSYSTFHYSLYFSTQRNIWRYCK